MQISLRANILYNQTLRSMSVHPHSIGHAIVTPIACLPQIVQCFITKSDIFHSHQQFANSSISFEFDTPPDLVKICISFNFSCFFANNVMIKPNSGKINDFDLACTSG